MSLRASSYCSRVQVRDVERLLGSFDAHERDRAGPLCLVEQALSAQFLATFERFFGPARDDLLGRLAIEAGEVGQEYFGSLVRIAADVCNARLGRFGEHALGVGLADEALFVAEAEVTRVDLQEFEHRVLKSAP